MVCADNLDRLVNNYIKMPVANQVHFYLLFMTSTLLIFSIDANWPYRLQNVYLCTEV